MTCCERAPCLIYQDDSPALQQEEEGEDKDSSMVQSEKSSSDEQEPPARMGMLKRIRQTLRRNTQDIKLVSGTNYIMITDYNHYFYSTCRPGRQYVGLCPMYRRP